MDQNTDQMNRLAVCRRKVGLRQKQLAWLLRLGGTTMLSRYERGRALPSLRTALGLAIILRIPVEFLFSGLYQELRREIQARQQGMVAVQGALF